MVLKHYFQRSLVQNIKNLVLLFQAGQRTRKYGPLLEGPAAPPKDYALIFEDQFEQLDWTAWRTGHPWGRNVHPDWQWKWWPHKSELTTYPTVRTGENGLELDLKNFPRIFRRVDLPEWQRGGAQLREWKATYAMGCISSKETYKFGWFEAEIKIPKGRGQWAAFWLSGAKNWPPEIDIFETYYNDNNLWVKPNVHFGNAGTWRDGKKDMGQPLIPLKMPADRWIKYAVDWTPDWIRFYYDGYLVQEFKHPAALKQNAQEQYIILNNGCENPDELGFQPAESTMLVRNLRVYQRPEWIKK